MSFFLQTVAVPFWLIVIMIAVMLPTLFRMFMFIYRIKRGDIVKEEQGDVVVWKLRSRPRTAVPKKSSISRQQVKEREQKTQLVQILKILLKEGDKGVLMKTVADRMDANIVNIQHSMRKLIEKNLVDEVVGVSGTKYYLTSHGKEYCRRKAK